MAKINKLYAIRMKYQRANVTDIDGLNRDVEKLLMHKKPTSYEFDILGGIFEFVSENKERANLKHRTDAEWRELERQHVVKADWTLPDLVDNLLRRLEKGKITRQQLEVERHQYKPCKHRFCLNYFIPQRRNAVFCSRDCKEREKQARDEFVRTSKIFDNGTYLPPTAYKLTHREELERAYEGRERLFEQNIVMKIAAKKELREYEYDGKRDRVTEERNLRRWRIDEEVKGGQNPVNIEETGQEPVKKIG
jgi:hypothetical protein